MAPAGLARRGRSQGATSRAGGRTSGRPWPPHARRRTRRGLWPLRADQSRRHTRRGLRPLRADAKPRCAVERLPARTAGPREPA